MISWKCKHTWKKSAVNTSWCLLGCSIGDFGTILYFQNNPSDWSTMSIMSLAMLNGLITSVLLETFILSKQMTAREALRTALGMSFISMLSMEMAMNLTDILLTGGAQITWWATPIMLTAGFLTPWPYNYWRLKKYNASCH
ncbi:MAG TPA: DUF4396 domain-containing protein [Candidatus Marinimicrobia bacterium]|jgi:hypothetical protein|nr:DUF4396 domain-containing protein [Candidatus Neomarinimicrobiota bacterium]HIL86393.1 DUF4396 domain-containing protein [Candidatus Neomarinimicrobiota bacterium]|tara:strand:+ start:475 stop:897 length:423 start_codon:yes stop_codon:yes gene_type:complete